ncbi:MAG: 30S ribosomal protein S23 [Parcubacteria group bacterium Gr01-1014_2]|nr:MAG: 30S ribosomal protein S23 [Parcubacteria group bacterium Gr01-1014_2]
MATIKSFEDLVCWQMARELTKEIYKEFKYLKDYGFKDQIQRATVSVMSNIAEGFERGTNQEFLNYLYIAKGSAGEVRAQLYVALDVGYLNDETFKHLNNLCRRCSILISGLIKSLKVSGFKGLQYKKENRKDPEWKKFLEEQNLTEDERGFLKNKI